MRVAKTKLDDVTIAKIEASGKTIYLFLQEAVALKLQNENAININNSLDRRLKEFEKSFENKIIQGIEISRNMLDEALQKDEVYKQKTVENLRSLNAKLQR